jgi:hypothetical protein
MTDRTLRWREYVGKQPGYGYVVVDDNAEAGLQNRAILSRGDTSDTCWRVYLWVAKRNWDTMCSYSLDTPLEDMKRAVEAMLALRMDTGVS